MAMSGIRKSSNVLYTVRSTLPETDQDLLLRQSLNLLAIVVVAILGLAMLEPRNDPRITLALYLPMLMAIAVLKGLALRGKVKLASWGLVSLLVGFVALIVVMMDGLNGNNSIAFTVSIMVTGALLGGRQALMVAILVVLYCTVILYMQLHDMLPPPIAENTPLNSWLALVIPLVLVAVLFQRTLHALRTALAAAEQNAQERDEAVQRFLSTQKMEIVGQLTGGVAHDFNNLLTVVSGSVSLLEEDLPENDTDAREILRDIDAAAARAGLMTRQLLSFSRARHTPTLESIDASAALRELSPMLPRLLGAPIQVKVQAADETYIQASRAGLEQILLNLTINAREAMPEGGTLSLSVEQHSDTVCLTVEDNGTGMEPHVRERLFEPFFTTKTNGTGLGLATVQELVRRFGGSIEVDSTLGEGTRFTLTFPVSLTPATLKQPHTPLMPSRRRRRVLLVDDDDLVRRTTARMLQGANFDVTAVVDGEEALALLESSEGFDVVVTDLSMPRLGGTALAEEMNRRGLTVSVVFISGQSPPDLAESTPSDFLIKPFSVERLVEAIDRVTT